MFRGSRSAALLVGVAVCSAALHGGEQAPSIGASIRLHLIDRVRLAPDTRRTMMNETVRVWRATSVAISWCDDSARTIGTDGSTLVEVVMSGARLPDEFARPLASIDFVDGRPTRLITAFAFEAERLLQTARVDGQSLATRPLLARRLLGRMLGRAIAHEIGHLVFQSPEHSKQGLMRARLKVEDLIAPDDRPFKVVVPPNRKPPAALPLGESAVLSQ